MMGLAKARRRIAMQIKSQIRSIGIDLGKTTFHLVALGTRSQIVVRKKFSRSQLLIYTANLPASLIGMEAGVGSHFLGRALREQGHEVRLIPAQFVRPFVKSNKNDYRDAEAIAEAVERENMRFVPIKTEDQLDLQAVHRVRDRCAPTDYCDRDHYSGDRVVAASCGMENLARRFRHADLWMFSLAFADVMSAMEAASGASLVAGLSRAHL
jgi:hypothetical protein